MKYYSAMHAFILRFASSGLFSVAAEMSFNSRRNRSLNYEERRRVEKECKRFGKFVILS
jgi:hypothetical protein